MSLNVNMREKQRQKQVQELLFASGCGNVRLPPLPGLELTEYIEVKVADSISMILERNPNLNEVK